MEELYEPAWKLLTCSASQYDFPYTILPSTKSPLYQTPFTPFHLHYRRRQQFRFWRRRRRLDQVRVNRSIWRRRLPSATSTVHGRCGMLFVQYATIIQDFLLVSSRTSVWFCHVILRLLALDLTPPIPTTPNITDRWSAEPIHFMFLPASTFIPNPKGYPVLPKITQQFVQTMMKVPTLVVT